MFRSRYMSLVSYLDEDKIKLVINTIHSNQIYNFAYILHDKDNTDPHYHILLQLNNSYTSKQVAKWFSIFDQNTFAQFIQDHGAIFRYLTHSNIEDDKAKYDESAIISNNIDFWHSLEDRGASNDKAFDILLDFHHDTPFSVMVQRYGRDFVLNYDRYKKAANYLWLEETRRSTTKVKPLSLRSLDTEPTPFDS